MKCLKAHTNPQAQLWKDAQKKTYLSRNTDGGGQEKVLRTDKSKFKVVGSQRRTFVSRRPNGKMLEEGLVPSVKRGWGNAMVRGRFGGAKVGCLYRVKGDLKAGRLSLHFAAQCRGLWTAYDRSQFSSYTGTMTQSTAPNYVITV